jgi:hypothetical protein
MIPLDYALAVALLVTPPQDGASQVPDDLNGLSPTMQQVALTWEILDAREIRYILAQPADFPTDVRLLRRRYQDLRDAPPVQEALRFPPRHIINDYLSFNRRYREYLQGQMTASREVSWEVHEVIEEVDHLYDIWDTVRDARCAYYYITVRRQALKKLRDLVGPEAYTSGNLPAHIPVWRFARID